MSAFRFNKQVLCSGLLLLIASVSAQAAPCTNASLIGAYGYQEQGQFIGGGYSEFRSIGALTFDGKGKGTRVTTIWYSDFHVNAETTFPIAYEVHPDCRFDLTYTDNGETFTGVIDNAGQKLLYLEISGDPMRSGQAERIAAAQNAH
jgi:hypothetical protein